MLTKFKNAPWRAWLKEALITLLICGSVYMVIRHFQLEAQRGGGGNLTPGIAAPAFELTEVRDGATVRLEDFRGRPAILNFWATWCPTCVEELPQLDQLHRESGGRFAVLSLSSEPPRKLKAWAREEQLELPILFDRGGQTSKAYAVEAIPTIVIIDAQGKLIHDFAGKPDIDILRDHMQRLIDEAGD
jgi:peroxiredoxin